MLSRAGLQSILLVWRLGEDWGGEWAAAGDVKHWPVLSLTFFYPPSNIIILFQLAKENVFKKAF